MKFKLINIKNLSFNNEYRIHTSILFGINQAFLYFKNVYKFPILYKSNFTDGIEGLPLSCLIWLNFWYNDVNTIINKIKNKISNGFIFFKIKTNKYLIKYQIFIIKKIINIYPFIKIRIDFNGCCKNKKEVYWFLNKLFYIKKIINYIEQPIIAGNWSIISEICKNSCIPVALDEELHSINNIKEKIKLLNFIKPQFIIIKPSIYKSFIESEELIIEAEKRNIKWCISSALDSNIGMNAISQWTFLMNKRYSRNMHHGLDTINIYENNLYSFLYIKNGYIWYKNINNEKINTFINTLIKK